MFKWFRTARTVLGTSRLPLRLHSQSVHEPLHIQPVQFQRKRFRPRNFLIGTAALSVCYLIWEVVVLGPMDHLAEELEKDLSEEEKKELDEEEEGLFIPFPFTLKKVAQRPYRGSDPEWQAYVKLSKDPKFLKALQVDLAGNVAGVFRDADRRSRRLGPLNVRRFWLDVEFPVSPPPTWERSGLEIAPDFIAWSSKPLDSRTVSRLKNVMWPVASATTFWIFCKSILSQNLEDAKVYTGFSTKKQSPFGSLSFPVPGQRNIPRIQSNDPIDKVEDDIKASADDNHASAERPKSFDLSESISRVVKVPSLNPTDASGDDDNSVLSEGLKRKLLVAGIKANMNFRKKYKTSAPSYPRGAIIFSGLVELESPVAIIVLDVAAAWIPEKEDFDDHFIRFGVRRMVPKAQGPRRS